MSGIFRITMLTSYSHVFIQRRESKPSFEKFDFEVFYALFYSIKKMYKRQKQDKRLKLMIFFLFYEKKIHEYTVEKLGNSRILLYTYSTI